jgi:hypothetical protein
LTDGAVYTKTAGSTPTSLACYTVTFDTTTTSAANQTPTLRTDCSDSVCIL